MFCAFLKLLMDPNPEALANLESRLLPLGDDKTETESVSLLTLFRTYLK